MPNVNIVLSILFATISAIADGMAWICAHLVKWSIITRMYLLFFCGNGPAISDVIIWNGQSEIICLICAPFLSHARLVVWQIEHDAIYSRTSVSHLGQ